MYRQTRKDARNKDKTTGVCVRVCQDTTDRARVEVEGAKYETVHRTISVSMLRITVILIVVTTSQSSYYYDHDCYFGVLF